MAPFNFDVKNGNVQNSKEHKISLLESVHGVPSKRKPLKGYRVAIEYWSNGSELAGGIVAQVHKLNGEKFTVPLKLEGGVTSEECLDQVNAQVSHYLFWLSQWEHHCEAAAKAWNELESLIK